MATMLSTIKGRLFVATLFTAILICSAIATTLFEGSRIHSDVRFQSNVVIPLNMAVRGMDTSGLNQGLLLGEQLLTDNLKKTQLDEIKNDSVIIAQDYAKANRLVKHFPALIPAIQEINKDWGTVKSMRDEIQKALARGDRPSALLAVPKEQSSWTQLHAKLEAVAKDIQTQKMKGRKQIEMDLQDLKWWSTGLLLVAMIIGGGTLLVTIIGAVRRIGSTRSMMQTATTGDADLSRRIAVRGTDEMDQIGLAFNAFLERIQGVVGQVAHSASMVSDAADKVSSMATQSSSGIEQQRSDTMQVAAAVNEMSETAHEVARNIQETSDVSGRTAEASKHGAALATSAIGSMNALQGELSASGEAISELSAGVIEIGRVTDLINQVTEQTNLLALNAAIEAARAGEQGRGFAVVAGEVRSLAQKTQDATGQIGGIIERLRASAESVVTSMDRTRAQSESAGGEVNEMAQSLAQISGMVKDIADRAAQVATAAEEQSAVAEEVNRNVTSISTITDQTAATVEHATGAATELSRLAGELNRLVAQFKGV